MDGVKETKNNMYKPFILAVIVGLDIYRNEGTNEYTKKQVKVAAALLKYLHTYNDSQLDP